MNTGEGTTEGAGGGQSTTVLETVEQIAEKVTGTADPGASVGVLLDWFAGLFHQVATSDHPPLAASKAAEMVQANKDALTSAVLATPPSDQGAGAEGHGTEARAQD